MHLQASSELTSSSGGTREALGHWFREKRKQRGLSQAQLASRLGMRQDSVSKIEGGKINISVDRAAEIARVLDETLDTMKITAELLVQSQRRRLLREITELAKDADMDDLRLLHAMAYRIARAGTRKRFEDEQQQRKVREERQARRFDKKIIKMTNDLVKEQGDGKPTVTRPRRK